jgi:CubicO group peptidase (beta-lactamase class C family)
MPGAPQDAYFARGMQGQYIVIVPSFDLVVVRLGRAFTPAGDIEAVRRLVNAIASALSS